MKPHLKFRRGAWLCLGRHSVGRGASAKDAYSDWYVDYWFSADRCAW